MTNVKAFPISRRSATVRETAKTLAGLHGEAALAFWKSTARDLLATALRHGSDEEDGRAEVRRFFGAVQEELQAVQFGQFQHESAGGSAA